MDITEVKVAVLPERNPFRTIITATKDPHPALIRSPPATTFTVTIMERICTVVQELMPNRTLLVRTSTDIMVRLVARQDRNRSRLLRIRDIMDI